MDKENSAKLIQVQGHVDHFFDIMGITIENWIHNDAEVNIHYYNQKERKRSYEKMFLPFIRITCQDNIHSEEIFGQETHHNSWPPSAFTWSHTMQLFLSPKIKPSLNGTCMKYLAEMEKKWQNWDTEAENLVHWINQ